MKENTPLTVEDVVHEHISVIGVKGINRITNQYGDDILMINQYSQLGDEEKKLITQRLNELYEDVKARKIENPANLGGRNVPLGRRNALYDYFRLSHYPGHVATVSPSPMPFRIEDRLASLDESILPFFLERFRYCGSNVVSSVELDRIEGLYSQYQEVYKNIEASIEVLNKIKHDEIRNGEQTEAIIYKNLITRIESGIKLSERNQTLVNDSVAARENGQEFKLSFPPESLTQLISAKISLIYNIKDCLPKFISAATDLKEGSSSIDAGEKWCLTLENILESHGHKSAVVFTMSDSSNAYPYTDYIKTRAEMGDPVSHVYIGNLQATSLDDHIKFSDNGTKVGLKQVTTSHDDHVVSDEKSNYVFSGSYDSRGDNNLTSIHNILKMIESSPAPVSLIIQKLDISHIPDITRAIKNENISQITIDRIDIEGSLVHKKCLQNLWEAATQSKLRDFRIKDLDAANSLQVCYEDTDGIIKIQNVDSVAFFAKLRKKVRYNSDAFDFNQSYEESVQAQKIAADHTNIAKIIFGEVESVSGLGQALLAIVEMHTEQDTSRMQSVKTNSIKDPSKELYKHMAALKKLRDWKKEIGGGQYNFVVLFTSLKTTLPYAGEGLSVGAEKLFSDIMSCDNSIKDLLLVNQDYITELRDHMETTEVREMLRECLNCETKRSKIDENGCAAQQFEESISEVLPAICGICNMIIILQMQNIRQLPKGPVEDCKISPVKTTNKCVVS